MRKARYLFGLSRRLLYISAATLGFSAVSNFYHHQGYWKGTIRRVQTVDFNILSHSLPTKLSYALASREYEEVQRTLDSNYGYFGLVVTNCTHAQADCPNQEVSFLSDSKYRWRTELDENVLASSSYDILRDPPPLYTEGRYDHSRDEIRNSTGLYNSGDIIGRVYYVRGKPPSFFSDYGRWIRKWPSSFLSNSGAHKYYSLTTLIFAVGGLTVWYWIESICAQRERQKEKAEHRQLALEGARNELAAKIIENEELAESRWLLLQQWENAEQSSKQKIVEMNQTIQNLEQGWNRQRQATELEFERQRELEGSISEKSEEVTLLRSRLLQISEQLTAVSSDKHQDKAESQRLKQELKEAQQEEADKKAQLNDYQEQLSQVMLELQARQEELDQNRNTKLLLEHQIQEARLEEETARKKSEELNLAVQATMAQQQEAKAELEKIETRIESLQPDLNRFEQTVKAALGQLPKVKSQEWLVESNFDLSYLGGDSRFADFVVVGRSFIVVIEAKGYEGKIQSEGDVQRTQWTSYSKAQSKRKVIASVGRNPYEQTKLYADRALNLMSRRLGNGHSRSPVKVYGVITFPDGSDISAIGEDIGRFYKVATLSRLSLFLDEIEEEVQQGLSGRPSFRAQNIVAALKGKPVKKASALRKTVEVKG